MEGDGESPFNRTPWRLRRRIQTDQNESRLLPHELRDHRASHPLPQPPMAPDLADRLHHHDGRLALPLLPQRRAVGDFQSYDRRPHRDGGVIGAHDRFPLVD
ncbi:unnamed protein product [Camellia sinensis]